MAKDQGAKLNAHAQSNFHVWFLILRFGTNRTIRTILCPTKFSSFTVVCLTVLHTIHHLIFIARIMFMS